MDNISYELCLYCEYENPLVNGFVAHICKSCGEEILPCSICPVLKNENKQSVEVANALDEIDGFR